MSPAVHAVDLRDGLVALVDEEQEVVREVVEQRVRRRAGGAAVHVAGVVLDAVAVADLPHHLDVVAGPLLQPLRLQELAPVAEPLQPLVQLCLDALDGASPAAPQLVTKWLAGKTVYRVDVLTISRRSSGRRS